MVYADVSPFEVLIDARYLHNMAPGSNGPWELGRVVAVSCYEGSFPTFEVLLSNGALFSYLPATALVHTKKPYAPINFNESELSHTTSLPGRLCVHKLGGLEQDVSVWFKSRNLWMDGEYMFTLDWVDQNQNLHLISLNNGQFAFFPNYRMLFGKGVKRELPQYKKLKREWK